MGRGSLSGLLRWVVRGLLSVSLSTGTTMIISIEGIGFHTPANVHCGFAEGVAQRRSQTLAAARAKHPHRFSTTTDPKILALPESAWINDPAKRVKEKPSLMII